MLGRKNRRLPIRLMAILAGAAMLAGLSGCSPSPPIYARLDDGVPVFMVCADGQPTSVEVKIADSGTVDYHLVWSVSGTQPVETGLPLTYGHPWPGWDTDVGPEALHASGLALSVVVIRNEDRSDLLNAVFDGENLPSDHWVNDQGVEETPCRERWSGGLWCRRRRGAHGCPRYMAVARSRGGDPGPGRRGYVPYRDQLLAGPTRTADHRCVGAGRPGQPLTTRVQRWNCACNGAKEPGRRMDFIFVVVALALALGGTYWHSRILAKNAEDAQDRRARGAPVPNTFGKRLFILLCAGALIGLSVWLTR